MKVVDPRDGATVEEKTDGEPTPAVTILERPEAELASAARLYPLSTPPEEPRLTAEELAARSQTGCLDSFEQLVLAFEKPVFNFLRQLTRNEHDAEDLTQETFLKAYRNLHRYRPSLSFATWLFVIARRTAASHFRSAKHFEEIPADTEGADENPATTLELRDEEQSLWKFVNSLKPKQAEAVWLRYAEGFSVAEIACIMHTNRVHVKVLLHRGRTHLAKMLVARGAEPSKSTPDRDARKIKTAPLNIVL